MEKPSWSQRLGEAPSRETIEKMRFLSKVDLHRHLEGSLQPEQVLYFAKNHKICLPADTLEELRPLVQVTHEDKTLLDFIRKFDTLALLFASRKIIRELTYEVIGSAHKDRVRYLELRFAPTYMASKTGLDFHEIVEGVLEGHAYARRGFPDVKVSLLLIVNRESSFEMARKMLSLALDYRKHGIVGMDLAGDEANYAPELFQEVFQEARQAGLFVTLHAGEARGSESVETAIEKCKAQRIGHGVRISGNLDVEKKVATQKVFLEICPTSNVQTGAVPDWKDHPICSFLEKKIPVTINTDDPGVSGITLSYEFARLHDLYKISLDTLKSLCLSGIDAAFLQNEEKAVLRKALSEELKSIT